MGDEPCEGDAGSIFFPALTTAPTHYTSPDSRLCQSCHSQPCCVFFLYKFVHPAQTGHPRTLSSSQHTFIFSLAKLPSQVVMSVPGSGKGQNRQCNCGCNCVVSLKTANRHEQEQWLEFPPSKRRRIAHFQAGHSCGVATSSSNDNP